MDIKTAIPILSGRAVSGNQKPWEFNDDMFMYGCIFIDGWCFLEDGEVFTSILPPGLIDTFHGITSTKYLPVGL